VIFASLLLAQAVAAVPPPAETEAEIVVLAERLAQTRVEWTTRQRNGAMAIRRCKITRSSGYRELDAMLCKSLRHCAPHIPLGARANEELPDFYACAEEHRLGLFRAWVQRREKRG
jgi:hypothetical protein